MSEPITDLTEAVAALGALPMPVGTEPRGVEDGEHYAVVHHEYRLSHDLPVPVVCRCDEPGADPYACEADDCHGEFSELNPFAGARPVDEPSAEVSRKCDQCSFRTTVWHVDDGSAEEELHHHVTRVHGGAS